MVQAASLGPTWGRYASQTPHTQPTLPPQLHTPEVAADGNAGSRRMERHRANGATQPTNCRHARCGSALRAHEPQLCLAVAASGDKEGRRWMKRDGVNRVAVSTQCRDVCAFAAVCVERPHICCAIAAGSGDEGRGSMEHYGMNWTIVPLKLLHAC